MIRLVDIDPDNWKLGLKVAPSQKTHVSDFATLLARAYAYRDYRSRAFVIYDDDTPIGTFQTWNVMISAKSSSTSVTRAEDMERLQHS